MEDWIVDFLCKNKLKISTAESCTGGMIASRIVNVSGASLAFEEGYITYTESAKNRILGVSLNDIEKYGVVSQQIAKEMAIGAVRKSGSNISISTTGIAGPTGGSDSTPVGTVCFGCSYKGETYTCTRLFIGDRQQIRQSATDFSLGWIKEILLNK